MSGIITFAKNLDLNHPQVIATQGGASGGFGLAIANLGPNKIWLNSRNTNDTSDAFPVMPSTEIFLDNFMTGDQNSVLYGLTEIADQVSPLNTRVMIYPCRVSIGR